MNLPQFLISVTFPTYLWERNSLILHYIQKMKSNWNNWQSLSRNKGSWDLDPVWKEQSLWVMQPRTRLRNGSTSAQSSTNPKESKNGCSMQILRHTQARKWKISWKLRPNVFSLNRPRWKKHFREDLQRRTQNRRKFFPYTLEEY